MDPMHQRISDHHLREVKPSPLVAKSEAFACYQSILSPYEEAMELMAQFERIEHISTPIEMDTVKRLYDRLQMAVQKVIVALGDLGDQRCGGLLQALQRFDRQTAPLFEPALSMPSHPILISLKDIQPDMISLVGHKAANLAAIESEIGLPVPPGFVLTARAFDRFMEENDLPGVIEAYLHDLPMGNPGAIEERCEAIRRLVLQSDVPQEIEAAIQAQMAQWQDDRGASSFAAVRSTAVGEDTEISFAGQFATLLNVPAQSLLSAYKEILASKYTPGAILYRMQYGLDDRATPMAVMVMAMIPSRASGVLYTRNPSMPDQADLHISAIHGLGEYLMSGDAAPHVLSICRRTGQVTIHHTTTQSHWISALPGGGTRLEAMPAEEQHRAPVDNAAARCLADWGTRLEKHFGAPQDVEWALDSQGRLFILQSRPLGLDGPSISATANRIPLERLPVIHKGGRKACSGIVSGRIYRAGQALPRERIPADSILVIPKAAPEYAPSVGLVRGVIAAKGSAASHLASVAREFGVPMIVDTGLPIEQWIQGQWVTLHADTATVYAGRIRMTDGGPLHALADPFETPVRRRMRALSSRITQHQPAAPDGAPIDVSDPGTLYDLLNRAQRYALESLHDQRSENHNPIRALRWTRDNAADDFKLAQDLHPRGSGKISPAAPDLPVGDHLLNALWSGLAWGTGAKTPTQPLGMEGQALIGDWSVWVAMPLGTQQTIVEAAQPPPLEDTRIRLRLVGGSDPYYKRCLRTRWLAGVLEELGFTLRINGALLEAFLVAEGCRKARDVMARIGRLLAFNHQADQALVGPWVVEDLKNCFLGSDPQVPSSLAGDLPSTLRPLAGNWRQATLNNRSVVVQDGAAVRDTPHPPLKQRIVYNTDTYRAFLKQLNRDHFFPLAIAGASHVQNGQIDLSMNLLTGSSACAGGVVFGFRDPGSLFMVGLDALHKRIVLYEFIHGRRFKRLRKRYPVHTDRWYDISLRVAGLSAHLQLNGVPLMAYSADRPMAGQVGMWAAADTVVVFDGLSLMVGTRQDIPFST